MMLLSMKKSCCTVRKSHCLHYSKFNHNIKYHYSTVHTVFELWYVVETSLTPVFQINFCGFLRELSLKFDSTRDTAAFLF
jgi:hypothetical protein